MRSTSTSSFYGRRKLESSHFKQKNAIVDFNVSDKEEDNEDIRDEIDDIVEGFDKKSDDEWSESNDTDFLDENNSSGDTESDEEFTAGTSARIFFRWRKKQPCSFYTSLKGEHFLLHHWILYHLISSLKSFFITILLNTLRNKQIYTQFKLVVNR